MYELFLAKKDGLPHTAAIGNTADGTIFGIPLRSLSIDYSYSVPIETKAIEDQQGITALLAFERVRPVRISQKIFEATFAYEKGGSSDARRMKRDVIAQIGWWTVFSGKNRVQWDDFEQQFVKAWEQIEKAMGICVLTPLAVAAAQLYLEARDGTL